MLDATARKPRIRKGSLAHLADRNAVLRTAAYLFDKHGYVETTMQDIADRLQISKPTLYKHAKSKSDILQLIINQWIDQSDETLDAAAACPETEQRIAMVVRRWTELAVLNRAHLKVFLSDEKDMPPAAIRRYRQWSAKVYRQFRDFIADGQRSGHYRPDADPTVAAFAILGFILLLPRWLNAKGKLEPRQVADEFLKTFMDGLRSVPPARETDDDQ